MEKDDYKSYIRGNRVYEEASEVWAIYSSFWIAIHEGSRNPPWT